MNRRAPSRSLRCECGRRRLHPRLGGERGLESRAVEDVTDISLGDTDLVPSGARNTTRVMRREIQAASAFPTRGSMNSAIPAEPTPSPHRTGAPTASSRSRTTTATSVPARAASRAAISPAGPPPMMRTSQSSTRTRLVARCCAVRDRSSRARTQGRARCTFDTLCRLARLYAVRSRRSSMALGGQSGTHRPHASQRFAIDDSNLDGMRSRRIARDVMKQSRLCQANALLAHTRSATLRPDAPFHVPSVPPARLEPLLDALAFLESGKIVFPGECDCGRSRHGQHADLRQGRRHRPQRTLGRRDRSRDEEDQGRRSRSQAHARPHAGRRASRCGR